MPLPAPPPPPAPTAAVIIIGNEILSGRTRDTNLGYLAEKLAAKGVPVREARVVPDLEAEIIAAVDACRRRYTYVFTTGGIGPTHDDITSAAIAKAFGVDLVRDPEAVRRLETHYARAGGQSALNPARLRMAEVPAGARLIDNPVSQAPGFQIANVFVLAGVPTVMRAMADGLIPRLAGGPPIHARTVSCALAEGAIASDLAQLQERWPEVAIGSYPYFRNGFFGVSLVLSGGDETQVEAAAADTSDLVRRFGGTPIVSVGTRADEPQNGPNIS